MASARTGRIVIVICLFLATVTLVHATDHLLISEVVVTPTSGEFVEIFNPTDTTIDLSDVYLTDATFSVGSQYYYNIVTGANAGGGGFNDFHARFPDGAIIASHEYQTMAIAGSDDFFATYGADPTYELLEDGASADGIPDMREALSGSIDAASGLSNGGEVVVLYHWDGATDLVEDLDYAVWGDKAEAVDKTGVAIDGPDPDTVATAYFNDTAIASQDVTSVASHIIGNSYTRIDKNEGTETMVSGNGLTGHDETSENLSATFAELAVTPNGGSLLGIGVSIDDVSLLEGDSGETTFVFTVSLTEPAPSGGVSYDIATADGSATVADLDYDTASDGQVIAEGETTEVFNVIVNGDWTGEINEEFLVEITNVVGTDAEVLDGTGIGTILNDDDVAIHTIQGAGESSPLEGSVVTTADNVVTAVGPEGFFIQTPVGDDDGNPDTSEGIYVFTGSLPAVAVGDLVDVTGTVAEFYEFTQIEGSPVVLSSGVPIPAPVSFDAATPSPDPTAPSCTIEYECYEGMLVAASGNVVGPSQFFGTDPEAEFLAIATAGAMPFREIGAEYPGFQGVIALPPGIPVFDGNPEIFEIDPDKLGQPNVIAKPGDTYAASGPLAYEFGNYEIWAAEPVTLTSGPSVVVPVRQAAQGEMTIASLNMFRFYDDIDDAVIEDDIVSSVEYLIRRTKFRRYILEVLRAPDVIGLQEIEKLEILTALAADIEAEDPTVSYSAHLVPGNNIYGMNVGYLVRDTVESVTVTQLGFDDILVGWDYKLFDHPPLLIEGTWVGDDSASFDFAALNNHTRSLGGVDEPFDDFARAKRFQQAQSIAQKAQDFQTAEPNTPLVLIGDYNAFQFTDGYVDVIGQIRGEVNPEHNVLSGPVITVPTLANEIEGMPAGERYSYLYRGTHQVFDHALTGRAAQPYVADQQYGRGNADSPGFLITDDSVADRSSDHDGMVLYLDTARVLFADGFETGDTTRWSAATH
jgi:predicted extracellular nuclease